MSVQKYIKIMKLQTFSLEKRIFFGYFSKFQPSAVLPAGAEAPSGDYFLV